MEKRRLGRIGFEATVLGFGAMEIRGNRIWNGLCWLPRSSRHQTWRVSTLGHL